ncbi:acetyltransferase [Bartonella kosoyi]|uniref:Acetyltransferase n=1 Tax=Bartonella kosoyi TaxID=2133959 RepID=A0A5B9CW76_9HYPH|nr:hypothetical protein [Bartonella kosoyi]QEE08651.1 acetyltransferase [Bartonella kosoyi]QEE08892.1 acetyltransferase [Bartonella kosoyi]
MEKPILINSNEILLVICEDEDQNLAKYGPFFEEKEVIKFIDHVDNAVEIFRIEPTNNRCEDISEDAAELYLKKYEEECFEGGITHDFVLHSSAYGVFLDDIKRCEYEDEMYGTYEQQHRLRPCDVL